MAAIALKGMDKATTNFPKERYVHEPFMQVRCHSMRSPTIALDRRERTVRSYAAVRYHRRHCASVHHDGAVRRPTSTWTGSLSCSTSVSGHRYGV